MPHRIQVPLTPRSSVSFNNYHQALIVDPSSIPEEVFQVLAKHGYRMVGVHPSISSIPQISGQFAERIPTTVTKLRGVLGAFEAFAQIGNKEESLGTFSLNKADQWDVVIDGGESALFAQEVTPLGYFRFSAADSDELLTQKIGQVEGMLEQWENGYKKAKYFNYESAKCAHFNLGHTGCSRCLDACPALAISSDKGVLNYDSNHCQGCGTCALVCPTGAVTYAVPKPGDVLVELVKSLDAEQDKPGNLILIICDALHPGDIEQTRVLQLPEVTAYGAELWLNALAMGFAGVLIRPNKMIPPTTLNMLEKEARLWNSVLGSQRIAIDDFDDIPGVPLTLPLASDDNSWPTGKQALIHHALDRILSGREESTITLPENAPLGQINIDEAECSQCQACVQLCPVDALTTSENEDSLWFRFNRCAQCGICSDGCPEHAITLQQALPVSYEARTIKKKMFDVNVAKCRACGTPFMSQKVLDSIALKLREDKSINQDLIYTCQACRVNATLSGSE